MSYTRNQEKISATNTGKVASATQADSATTATTATSATTAVTATTANSVADGSITTAKIANAAVTGIKRGGQGAVLASVFIPNGNKLFDTTQLVGTLVVPCTGEAIQVGFEIGYIKSRNAAFANDTYFNFTLYRNGVVVPNAGINFGGNVLPSNGDVSFPSNVVRFIDPNPPAGNNTYQIYLTDVLDYVSGIVCEFDGVTLRARSL